MIAAHGEPAAPKNRPMRSGSVGGAGWKVTALLAALMTLLWFGPVQLHPPLGWVDPGLYIYWFHSPAENFALRGGDYHGTRLGFVLPGVILYALFGMVTAQALLVSAFYLIGLLAVYAISAAVLQSFAARAAVVVFVALNPVWLAAMTRGYVDGPSIALGLAALAVMLRHWGSGGGWRPIASGALLSLCFFTHPFGGGLAGLGVAGLVLARTTSPLAMLAVAARIVLGALLVFLALGLAATALGMPFLFLETALPRIQQGLTTLGPTSFYVPFSAWIAEAPRVVFFPLTLLLLGGGLWMARGVGREVNSLGFAAVLPLVAMLATLPLWAGFLLQFNFYASYIWLALVPALALFARGVETASAGRTAWLAVAAGATGLFSLALLLPLEMRQAGWQSNATWALILLALASGLALLGLRRPVLALPALLLAGSLAGAMNRDTATVLRLPGGADLAAQHAGLARMHSFLDEAGWLSGRYLVWLDRARFTVARGLPAAHLYGLDFAGARLRLNALDSLAASLGWHVAAIGFDMPRLEGALGLDGNLDGLKDGTERLITLCAEPADCEEGLDALRARGLQVVAGPRREIEVQGMPRFTVLLANLRPAADATPDRAQIEIILRQLEPAEPEVRLKTLDCSSSGEISQCWVGFSLADGSAWMRLLRFDRVGPIRVLSDAQERVPAVLSDPHAPLDRAQVAAILAQLEPGAPGLRLETLDCLPGGEISQCRVGFAVADGSAWMRVLRFERVGPNRIFSSASEKISAVLSDPQAPLDRAQVAAILVQLEPGAPDLQLETLDCLPAGEIIQCRVGFSVADGSAWMRLLRFERVGPIRILSSAQEKLPAVLSGPQAALERAQVAAILAQHEPNAPGLSLETLECAPAGGISQCRVGFAVADGSAWMRLLRFERVGPIRILSSTQEKLPAVLSGPQEPLDRAQVAAILDQFEPDAPGLRLETLECVPVAHMRQCRVGFRLTDGSAWMRVLGFETVGRLALLSNAGERFQVGNR